MIPKKDGHLCHGPENAIHGGCGAAIGNCEEDEDGVFWVENGEYASPVLFCPYCGVKSSKPIPLKEDWEIEMREG